METEASEDTPALVAARAEHREIATNPENPRHAGYQRGDAQVSAYLDQLYRKAVPQTPATQTDPAPIQEPALNDMTLEDRVAQTEVEMMLRQTLGDSYDSTMREMGVGARHLFSTPEGVKILETLSPLITDLGPLAQVRSIRFLAELGELITNQQRRT